MPYATNRLDGVRSYFEDSAGNAPPVLFYTGFADPLEVSKASALAQALRDQFRVIFVDHRGQGGSDKPRDVDAYALTTRAADAVAVLDELNIDRGPHVAHGACRRGPVAASKREGMAGFVESFESALGYRFPEPDRTWTLEKNDPAALEAAWRSVLTEGPISNDLSKWQVPCLICVGAADEMHDDAEKAAGEIPGATFVSLAGHSHISALYEADALLLPYILDLFQSATLRHDVLLKTGGTVGAH